nr:MAG TPA: hypothetical protein [Caudoviricetes sp.]
MGLHGERPAEGRPPAFWNRNKKAAGKPAAGRSVLQGFH